MATQSPIAVFPELVAGQASAEVKVNEMGHRIETLASLEILDRGLTAPPGSPSDGDAYIPAATATDVWAGKEGKIAAYYGGWLFITPTGGQVAYVKDEKCWFGYSSQESAWHPLQQYHSTSETWTGRYCRQGQKIYCKTFDLGALPNNTAATQAHSISNLDLDGRILVTGWMENGTNVRPLPSVYPTAFGTENAFLWLDATNINIKTNWNATSWDGEIYVEYTKTA